MLVFIADLMKYKILIICDPIARKHKMILFNMIQFS